MTAVDEHLPDWWNLIAAWADNLWPGQMDEYRSVAYFSVLGGLDADRIQAAFGMCIAEGARTGYDGMPSAGKIYERATRDYTIPVFERAWPVIADVLKHHRDLTATAAAELETTHPVLAEFVASQGARRLLMLEVDHPQWGEKTRRELKVAYEQLVAVHEQRGRDAEAIATMPQLRGRGAPRGLEAAITEQLERIGVTTQRAPAIEAETKGDA